MEEVKRLGPVAWLYANGYGNENFYAKPSRFHQDAGWTETPLYDHPAPKPADSQLVEVVMRELGVQEMVMADPQTLKRLQAERILRALAPHLSPSPSYAERDRFRVALEQIAAGGLPITIAKEALASGAHREAGE